ncbi:M1 family metallopeptidase [Aurantiacibacter spongiae]|uniref:Aminopeptidase n=1 Tax=Aurantiacibacter spongiae TaxID=2488860 RepID=A0A3N5CR82_9SPHN|nr:M1 family metallopeptidase [Aurantiacibacter spongiae]RPF71574.1 M1 family peptidase [Aurantiacibacter spongiae]
MRHASLAALAAALLAGCATVPAPQDGATAPTFTAAPLPADVTSDLPRIARPLNYAIQVVPDAENLTFSGASTATIEVYEATRSITMHAKGLDITSAVLVAPNGLREEMAVSYDGELDTVTFTADSRFAPGTYQLQTQYAGTIGTQAAGLFALDYPDKRTGEEVRALFTQFEAPDARRFAPLFDEPSYKATFDLSAIVPADLMAVGNMPIAGEEDLGNGTKRVTFRTTPIMSSYLLFFALGDFERNSAMADTGTEVGIVAPAGSGEQTQYALDGLKPLMPWFTDYFGIAYPLPKLDNVTAPGQSQFFGAMENWGSILTFERILLNDPANTSPATRQSIFSVQAHETAHQWFGDIVTMAWWDDLWLNEAFASWLETKVTNDLHPEWYGDLGRVNVREAAMNADDDATSHPVIQDISTVAETAQAFDTITYSKGEALIGMFEDYAGADVWQRGLQAYFQRHQYGNTQSPDLWRAIAEAGASDLPAIADDFTLQPGVPLVLADGPCVNGQTQLQLVQSQFSRDRKAETEAEPAHWLVPLSIANGSSDPVDMVLDNRMEHSLPGCSAPLVVNSGQLGYYRTLYSPRLSQRIADGFSGLAPIDQLGLMRDGFALAVGDYQAWDRPLALLEQVPPDANPIVAQFAVQQWASIYSAVSEDNAAERSRIAEIATEKWRPRLDALGYDAKAGEPVVDANLRNALIGAFDTMGDEGVQAEARRRFAMLEDDPRALDGSMKNLWLGIAGNNLTTSEWALLSELAVKSTSTTERATYYTLLGAPEDEALARQALNFALTGEAGTTSAAIIRQVAAQHPELAYDFVMQHQDEVRELVDPSGWQGYIAGLTYGSRDPAQLERLEEYRADIPDDEAVSLDRAINAFRVRLETDPRVEAAIIDWLGRREG